MYLHSNCVQLKKDNGKEMIRYKYSFFNVLGTITKYIVVLIDMY